MGRTGPSPGRETLSDLETTIIGAGPYGLSMAAHLRDAGLPYRIFGTPLET